MKKTAVLNIVGLSKRLIGDHTPFLKKWIDHANLQFIRPAFPAVTCTAQSNYLTGKYPDVHGIVGNGWYFRDECDVRFWRQSNKLVQAKKIWEELKEKDKSFTCANIFWWFNMYSTADYSVTPRPQYPADGRKIPDIYTNPPELRDKLQNELGQFPLFNFWGPASSVRSSKWIAACAKMVDRLYDPALSLIYLPHLDYCLQKNGNDPNKNSGELLEIDSVCEDLIRYFEKRNAEIILLSEYTIGNVSRSVHLNRILREHGLLRIRNERGLELLDTGASEAFAVADHQIAHVYVNNRSKLNKVRSVLERTEGIEFILDNETKKEKNIHHDRSGDFVVSANDNSWFTYYYWNEDKYAPDFARTVDIHRKPGYDPVELFYDPEIKFLLPSIGWKLLKKKIGMRTLMDLIPLNADLVRGSHGRIPEDQADCPVLVRKGGDQKEILNSVETYNILKDSFLQ